MRLTYTFSRVQKYQSFSESTDISTFYMFYYHLNTCNSQKDERLSVHSCAVDVHIHVFVSVSPRSLYVYMLVCICLSSNISQKQHISQFSLHPKETLFHSRMLLMELRRIFQTVWLTLCWQTETHPHTPKHCGDAGLNPVVKRTFWRKKQNKTTHFICIYVYSWKAV